MIRSCISDMSLKDTCVFFCLVCFSFFFSIGYFCHSLDSQTTNTQEQAHHQDFTSPSGYTQFPCNVQGTGRVTSRGIDYKAVNKVCFWKHFWSSGCTFSVLFTMLSCSAIFIISLCRTKKKKNLFPHICNYKNYLQILNLIHVGRKERTSKPLAFI